MTVVLMAMVFGYPPFAEGTDGPCGALVILVADHVMAEHGGVSPEAQAMVNALGRPMGYKIMADRYRQIPVQVTCTYTYWRAMVDPGFMDETTKVIGSALGLPQ